MQGAIDGTHIPILASDYINKRVYFSMVLQALVDNKDQFMDISISWWGEAHDACIFWSSCLFQKMYTGTFFPDCTIRVRDMGVPLCILGDASSSFLLWLKRLIKLYTDSLDSPKENFNSRLSKCHMVMKRAFVHLKGRVRSLLTHLDLSK